MIKAIIRTGLLVGAASGAAYLAKKYFGGDFDRAVDKVKSFAKDANKDLAEKDDALNASLRNHI